MAVDPNIQSRLDAANQTALTGTGYLVNVQVGEKTVTWTSVNKTDLKDTLTAAVSESGFQTASIQKVAI